MSDDFYTMVDSGDPAPDNEHITGVREKRNEGEQVTAQAPKAMYAARIAVYDDMLSTPRVIVIEPQDVRTYLEETTNTVYQCMKEQGGRISLMVIREIVENFIHAHFAEPIISILDGGDTIRFADQGPGIDDKERAFDFGVTSANSKMKRYIRGTGAGFPMVQEYLENAGGAVSIEDNMGNGTVVTVSLNPKRVQEIERAGGRGGEQRVELGLPVADGGAGQHLPAAVDQAGPVGGLADVQAEHGPRSGRWRFHGGILPVVVRPDGLPLGTHITSRGACPALSYQPSGAARPAPAAPNGPSRGQGRSAVRGRPVGGPFWARLNRSPRRARADNFDCNGRT